MNFNIIEISRKVISNLNYCKQNLLEQYEIMDSKYNAKDYHQRLQTQYGIRVDEIQEIRDLVENDLQWFDEKLTTMKEVERYNIDITEIMEASTAIPDNSSKQEIVYSDAVTTITNSEYLSRYIIKYGKSPQDLDSIPLMFYDDNEKKIYVNENVSDIIIQNVENKISLCKQDEFLKKYVELYGEIPFDLDSIPVEIYDEKNGKIYINENASDEVVNEVINNVVAGINTDETNVDSNETNMEYNKNINKVLNESDINIYNTDEEFMEAYINAGGTETDISKIEAFFDTKTNEVYARNVEDTNAIINSIKSIINEDSILNHENGQVFDPSNTEGENTKVDVELDEDSKIDMSNESSKDFSYQNVENIEEQEKTGISNKNSKDSSYQHVENIEEKGTIEMGDIKIGNSSEDLEVDVDKN